MKSKLIYSANYDLLSKGVELFHPFYGQKYSRAWSELRSSSDIDLKSIWIQPEQPITDDV